MRIKSGGKVSGPDGFASTFIMVMLDGIGDRAYRSLGNRTPLQAARTPNMDRLAALGANGLFHADLLGLALPSENAHFAIFGYEKQQFPGRGYLEALGAGMSLGEGDVALLAHFVSARERGGILELEADRPAVTSAEALELTSAVSSYKTGGITISYRQTKAVDGIVTLAGKVSPAITDSDPICAGLPLIEVRPFTAASRDRSAMRSARALMKYFLWCYETLNDHPINRRRVEQGLPPANLLVTQRAGQHKQIWPFSEQWGLRGMTIASGIVYWGLAEFIGLEVRRVKDSDDPGRDLAERLQIALANAGRCQFVHVHSKAPDAAAHSKDPENKVRAIESLDRGLAELVHRVEDGEIVYAISSDHSTPSCGTMVHAGEPVPLTFVGPGVRRDLVKRFDEIHCAQGALGFVRGPEFMPLVLNYLDRGKLQGLMDTPENQPYWPGQRYPFRVGPAG